MADTLEFPDSVDVEVAGSLSVNKWRGKFPSPSSRTLYVEPEGKRDFQTISAAIDYAVNGAPVDERAGPATWLRWTIEVSPGVYDESFDLKDGCDLTCPTPMGARVNGQVTQRPFTTISNMYLNAPAGAPWALHMDATGLTSASARPRVFNSYIVSQSTSINGDIDCVRITGGVSEALPIIYGFRDCTLYVGNRYTGPGTAGRMQHFHWMLGSNVVVEAFGGMHYKSSSGSTGIIKSPTLGLIESTGSCYLHSEGSWNAEYANDPANPPMFIRSSTPTYAGGFIDVAYYGEPGVYPTYSHVYTGANPVYFAQNFERVYANSLVVGTEVVLPGIPAYTASTGYPPQHASAKVPTVLTAGTMRSARFRVRSKQAFVSLGIGVTTGAAGSTIRLMLYADNGAGKPGALIADGGTADSSSASTVTKSIAATLAVGEYHLVVGAIGGSPTVYMYSGLDPMVGQSAGNSTINSGFTATYAGTAPATFSTLSAMTATTVAPFIVMTTAA